MQARFAEKPRNTRAYYGLSATQAMGHDLNRSRSLSRTSSGAGGSFSSLWDAQEMQEKTQDITRIEGFNRPQPPGKRVKYDLAAPIIVLSSSEDGSMSLGSETSMERTTHESGPKYELVTRSGRRCYVLPDWLKKQRCFKQFFDVRVAMTPEYRHVRRMTLC